MSIKLERYVEADFKEFCKALNIVCKKLKLAGESSWPDRTLLYRGHVMFLELKRSCEKPEPLQLHTLDLLTKMGFEARWSNDFEQMKLIVLAWRLYVNDSNAILERFRKESRANQRTGSNV